MSSGLVKYAWASAGSFSEGGVGVRKSPYFRDVIYELAIPSANFSEISGSFCNLSFLLPQTNYLTC